MPRDFHIQNMNMEWEGQTLYFGEYSVDEAIHRSNLIKLLAARWRRQDVKPSKEWVDSEIRRRLSIPVQVPQPVQAPQVPQASQKTSTSDNNNRSPKKRSPSATNSNSSKSPAKKAKVKHTVTSSSTTTINAEISRIHYNDDFQVTPKIIKDNRGLISGKWIRDKRIEPTSLREHFEAMGLSKDSIESHVKKDEAMDTICEIHLTPDRFKVRAFYIQDTESQPLAMSFPIGQEVVERSGAKRTLITSDHPTSVVMKRSVLAITGFVEVCDTKQVISLSDAKLPESYTERPEYMMKQTMTVENHKSQKKHTIIRYYLPFAS